MSIIDDVNKLAQKEREIRGIQKLITVVSSLSDEDLAKAWPRIIDASQKAIRKSLPPQENDPLPTQTNSATPSSGENIPEQNDVPYYMSPERQNILLQSSSPPEGAIKAHGKGRLAFRLLAITTPVLLFSAGWQLVTYSPHVNSTSVTKHANDRITMTPTTQAINNDLEKIQLARTPKPGSTDLKSGEVPESHAESGAPPATDMKRKNVGQPPAAKPLENRNDSFVVTAASFVRAKPTSKAAILATLEPGTKIRVAGRTGDYFRVRVMEPQRLSGFVHKQDAFFERRG